MKHHIEFMLLNFIIPLTLALGFMSLSLPDRNYVLEITVSIPILGYLLFFFIIYYATPAYVIVFLIKKAAEFFKLKNASKRINDAYSLSSIPIGLLAFGFAFFYIKIRNLKKIDNSRTAVSNLLSLILIASLQARIFLDVLYLAAVSSIVFFIVGTTIVELRKVYGPAKSD